MTCLEIRHRNLTHVMGNGSVVLLLSREKNKQNRYESHGQSYDIVFSKPKFERDQFVSSQIMTCGS